MVGIESVVHVGTEVIESLMYWQVVSCASCELCF